MKKKQRKILWNYYKKGQDANLLFVAIMILVLAIVIVSGLTIVKQFNKTFKTLPTIPQDAKDVMQTVEDKYVTRFDILFVFVFVLIYISLVASAFFIDTHPIFFIISMIMAIVTAVVGGYIANAYSGFAAINAEASQFRIIPFIFQHYITMIIIMGFSVGVALYAKLRSASG